MNSLTDTIIMGKLNAMSPEVRMQILKTTESTFMAAVHYLCEHLEAVTKLSRDDIVEQLQQDLVADGFIAEDFCIRCYFAEVAEWCFGDSVVRISPNSVI